MWPRIKHSYIGTIPQNFVRKAPVNLQQRKTTTDIALLNIILLGYLSDIQAVLK